MLEAADFREGDTSGSIHRPVSGQIGLLELLSAQTNNNGVVLAWTVRTLARNPGSVTCYLCWFYLYERIFVLQ